MPVLVKQVPQIFVALLTFDAFNSADLWVLWEHVFLAPGLSVLGNGSSAKVETNLAGKSKYSAVWEQWKR